MLTTEPHQSTQASTESTGPPRARVRRRVWPLPVAAFALCALVIWQRDARQIDWALAGIERFIPPLEAHLTQNGTLPIEYPDAESLADDDRGFTYADPEIIRWAATADRPVIIAFTRGTGLIVRPNGHAVIIYDNGGLRAVWVTNTELGKRRDAQRDLARSTSGDS